MKWTNSILGSLLMLLALEPVSAQPVVTPIDEAAYAGDLARVKELYAAGALQDTLEKEGFNAFDLSVIAGHADIAKWFIEKGSPVNRCINAPPGEYQRDPLTVLSLAAMRSPELIPLLLRSGADPNLSCNQTNTPLSQSVRAGKEKIVKQLIAAGANVNTPSVTEKPLIVAFAYYKSPIAERLIDAGADVNVQTPDGFRAVHIAATRNNIKGLDLLKKAGAVLNAPTQASAGALTPIQMAAQAGNLDAVQWFAKEGHALDVLDMQGNNLLMLAVDKGALNDVIPLMQWLLQKNIPLDAKNRQGETALLLAAQSDEPQRIKWLYAQGAALDTLDKQGLGLFWRLYRNLRNYSETDLIAWSAAIYTPRIDSAEKQSLFFWAIEKSNDALLEKLMTQNLNLEDRAPFFRTPLLLAIHHDNEKAFQRLMAEKVSLETRDTWGHTALLGAADSLNLNMIKGLLAAHANVNTVDDRGENALHIVAHRSIQHGDVSGNAKRVQDIVKLLLKAGVSIHLKNTEGMTPLMIATENEDPLLVSYLTQHGAR